MKVVSEGFRQKAENAFGARYFTKIVVDGQEITEGIESFKYSSLVNPDGAFSFGNTCCASVSFSIDQSQRNLLGKEIEVYQGLEVDGSIEYILLGKFEVQKRKEEKGTFFYECYDYMGTRMETLCSREDIGIIVTDINLLRNICASAGIYLEKEDQLTPHMFYGKPVGYTKRELIGYLAQLQGKNAIINEKGNLELVWYTDTNFVVDDEKIYLDGADAINDATDYTLEYLKCVRKAETAESQELKSGEGVVGITFENPFMTQEILDEVYSKLQGFSFRSAEVEFLGDFRLEVGDVIQVVTAGTQYRIPIMQLEHNCDGGVITTIESVAETDQENQVNISGPSSKQMDRYYAELVLINEAVVDKLSAEEADVRYLKADEMDVITANIENAVVENLETNFATIKNLEATNARIGDLEADVADVNNLMFGAAGGTSIHTEFSNAVAAQIGDAQIKSAMIEDVSASKISAGDIVTNNVCVKSEDGSLIISDETMQISDEKQVRVQIGKDESGDYSINVWDADGNLMFSQGGITDSAIKEAIIRNEMISDTANIDAGKLNIGSLYEKMNDDGEHTLLSSKIYLDDKAQTLDVAFQKMTETMDDVKNIQSSQETALSVIQGEISSKVWEQDIVSAVSGVSEEIDGAKDEVAILKTQYAELDQTVDGISMTVGSHTTQMDGITTSLDETKTNYEQLADKFSWVVASGDSNSNFTLTDKMANLTAEVISLNGAVKVDGSMIVDGAIDASKINATDLFAQDITASGCISNTNEAGNSLIIDMENISIKSVDSKMQTVTSNPGASLVRYYPDVMWVDRVGAALKEITPTVEIDNGALRLCDTQYSPYGVCVENTEVLQFTNEGIRTPNIYTSGISCRGSIAASEVTTGVVNVGNINALGNVSAEGTVTGNRVKSEAGADLDVMNSKLMNKGTVLTNWAEVTSVYTPVLPAVLNGSWGDYKGFVIVISGKPTTESNAPSWHATQYVPAEFAAWGGTHLIELNYNNTEYDSIVQVVFDIANSRVRFESTVNIGWAWVGCFIMGIM